VVCAAALRCWQPEPRRDEPADERQTQTQMRDRDRSWYRNALAHPRCAYRTATRVPNGSAVPSAVVEDQDVAERAEERVL
jgi:hypothetical protein